MLVASIVRLCGGVRVELGDSSPELWPRPKFQKVSCQPRLPSYPVQIRGSRLLRRDPHLASWTANEPSMARYVHLAS